MIEFHDARIGTITGIDNTHRAWAKLQSPNAGRGWFVDLTQLRDLEVIDSLAAAGERRAEHEARTTRNIGAGALIGGLIDAGSGDDSIIDGAIFGGLLGAAASGPAPNDNATLVAYFKDGSYLTVEADASGCGELVGALRRARSLDVPAKEPVRLDEPPSIARDEAASRKGFTVVVLGGVWMVGSWTLQGLAITAGSGTPDRARVDRIAELVNSVGVTAVIYITGISVMLLGLWQIGMGARGKQ